MIRLIMILSMALLVTSSVEAQEPTEAMGAAGEAAESGAAEAAAEPVAVDEASVGKGPEYGAAIGAQFKIFSIGARFKYAKFDPFDLLTAGVDMGFLVKRVPFVHPYARLGLYYNTTRGGTVIPVLDQLLENTKTNGGGASIGAGVRVPVIKWLSVAIGFDYTFIGLYVKGFDPAENEDFSNGTIGGEISGTFALTVHPI